MGKQADYVKKLQRKRMKVAALQRVEGMSVNELADAVRTTGDTFLASPEWKALRKEAFVRYGAVCARCGFEQTATKRINYDHIKPRKFFPELALDIENLQPLCPPCNKKKGNGPAIDYRKHTTKVS